MTESFVEGYRPPKLKDCIKLCWVEISENRADKEGLRVRQARNNIHDAAKIRVAGPNCEVEFP